MDERYTYGYNTGWNVENEYIANQKNIIDLYNAQIRKIDDLQIQRARMENILNQTINEDEIREIYNEYYADSLQSYESYREDVLKEIESRKELYKRDIERNRDEYYANLYYLIDIKNETRKNINNRRRELELLLEERRLQLSAINLESVRTPIQYDENRNILNVEQRASLRQRYDETFLEIRKLEHALQSLDEMFQTIDFTQEEYDLMMRGLNPQQRRYYDEIDKKPSKGDDPIGDDPIGDDPIGDDPIGDDPIGDDPIDDDPFDNKNIENYNLKELIYKIAGGNEYKPLDSFIYNHKEIKCFNWNKKKERTFADKPIRLVKTAISSIILGGSKLFSKIAYRKESVRQRIDICLENIKNLSDGEVDYLFNNLTATKMKDLQNILPDIAWKALYRRFIKRIHFKINLSNQQLKSHYLSIVSLYKEGLEIQSRLNSNSLSVEERKRLEERFKQISSELCEHIMEYDRIYANADNILNASGLHGISENYRARRTNSVGGRNAKYFDSPDGRVTVGIIGENIRESISRRDGFTAAKYFIYDQQVELENTENKRTLKNRFGLASVGIFQYSPLVEQADYSEDEYLKDVLLTITIAFSIMNMVQQKLLKEQLIAANNQIQMQNVEIAKLNQDIANLKNMFGQYNNDPKAFLDTYYTTLKNSLGGMQGTSEYLGMMAQAGANTNMLQSAGSVYKMFDAYSHDFFGNLGKQLEAIFTNPSLSQSDKILQMGKVYEQGVNEIARQAIAHAGNINAHIAQYGGSYDFSSIMSVLGSASSVDPSIITNVFNEYLQAAMYVNNVQAISYINSLNVNVDLTAATVTLAGIVGQNALDEYRNSKKRNSNKLEEESIEEMKQAISSVEIDEHEMAKERYLQAKEEWDKKGPFYKMFHQNEKPIQIDYDREILEEENGRSL